MKRSRPYLLVVVLLWGVLDFPVCTSRSIGSTVWNAIPEASLAQTAIETASVNPDIDDIFHFHSQVLPSPHPILVPMIVGTRITVQPAHDPLIRLTASVSPPLRT